MGALQVYTTPKSYLGLIYLYRELFDCYYESLSGEIDQLQRGLDRLTVISSQASDVSLPFPRADASMMRRRWTSCRW